jgi:hypothetical protein
MSQNVAKSNQAGPLSEPEERLFRDLWARLRAPGAIRSLHFAVGKGDDAKLGSVVVCDGLSPSEVLTLRELAERQRAPIGRDGAKAAAGRLVGCFPVDRFSDPTQLLTMIAEMLEDEPAPAVIAMVDPRNPNSLIRTSKFAPTIAEVSTWIETFMRTRAPSLATIAALQRGAETLARLETLPGFEIVGEA